MLGCLLVALPLARLASAESTATSEANATAYPVDHFEIVYAAEHSLLPSVATLQDAEVSLSRSEQAFIEPVPGLDIERLTLGQLAASELPLGPSAIGQVSRSLVALLNDRGLVGVYVAPAADDVDLETGADLRGDDRNSLRLVVWVGRAQKLRTTAAGYGIETEQGADRAQDQRILRNSPIQPYSGSGERSDLLEIEELQDYVHRLNRHPRRNTRLALSSGNEPATVNLEYQVYHERPWSLYTEASNHGTESTGMRRHRAGFMHHQLTGRDDTLHLEWLGGRPGQVQAMVGSYEAPVFGSERLRWRVSGIWSEFTADQLGFAGLNFEGQQSEVGGQLVANIFQHGRFFVDAFAGIAWQNIDVQQPGLSGQDENFSTPEAGLRLERFAPTSALSGEVKLRRHYSRADQINLEDKFTRDDVAEDPATAAWRLSYSTYIEPWLARALGRSDSNTGRAHELRFLGHGLWSFNERLIPQLQQIAGGATTVRGYSQAALAGDNVRVGTAEYRIHLPRLFSPRSPSRLPVAGEFAFVPKPNGANPDWDLVLLGFYDTAHVSQVDRIGLSGETSDTLTSLGVGLELAIKRLIRVQASCGWARDIGGSRVESSDRCRVNGMALY